MCGAAGMIALTAIQGINQYNQQKQQYNAQAAMYNTQAKLAENNARISQKKQEQIAEQYAAQQSKLNARMKLAAGQTAAQAGASGLQLSGSPLDALASSYSAWNDDSQTLLQNQRNDVWSERINEINYQNQANSYRASAANMLSQKQSALLGTILGTAANIYGIRSQYGNAGKDTETDNVFTGQYDINAADHYTGKDPKQGHYTYGITANSFTGKFRPSYTYSIRPINLDQAAAQYDALSYKTRYSGFGNLNPYPGFKGKYKY